MHLLPQLYIYKDAHRLLLRDQAEILGVPRLEAVCPLKRIALASGVVLFSTHLLDIAPLEHANKRMGDIQFAAVRQASQGAFAIQEQQHPALLSPGPQLPRVATHCMDAFKNTYHVKALLPYSIDVPPSIGSSPPDLQLT